MLNRVLRVRPHPRPTTFLALRRSHSDRRLRRREGGSSLTSTRFPCGSLRSRIIRIKGCSRSVMQTPSSCCVQAASRPAAGRALTCPIWSSSTTSAAAIKGSRARHRLSGGGTRSPGSPSHPRPRAATTGSATPGNGSRTPPRVTSRCRAAASCRPANPTCPARGTGPTREATPAPRGSTLKRRSRNSGGRDDRCCR